MGDVQLSIDHFVPLERGGISACRSCGKDKGSRDPKEYCESNKLDYEYATSSFICKTLDKGKYRCYDMVTWGAC